MSNSTPPARGRGLQLVSLAARLGLALIWLVSGALKLKDPLTTRQSVAAYELFSPQVSDLIGTALPLVEVILGILLLAGVWLRVMGGASLLLFAVFIAGIASAWARGLTIDCGCFGSGGFDPEITGRTYMLEILRDLGFMAIAAVVVWRPYKKFALLP